MTEERVRRGAVGVIWRQWPLLLVLGGGSIGLLTVSLGSFRTGCITLGAAVLFAALARAILPVRRVGLLVVRHRAFDVAVLLALGLAVVILAVIVPPAR